MASRVVFSEPPLARVNRPLATGNYNLSETDLGVVMTTQNSTCFFPAYTANQLGLEYGIKNGSGGIITIQAANNESFLIRGQQVSSVTVPADEARQVTRETSGNQLIIV